MSDPTKTRFLVGLGNPGAKYEGTRHNAGFTLARLVASRCSATASKVRGIPAEMYRAQHLIVALPTTYMNLSGSAVGKLVNWFKLEDLAHLLVVYDDVSLPLGKLRWRYDCSSGGHHGIDSIVGELAGRRDFPRLGFGVGPDPGGDRRADYVLSRFSPEEANTLAEASRIAVESVSDWLDGAELATLMNRYNGLDARVTNRE